MVFEEALKNWLLFSMALLLVQCQQSAPIEEHSFAEDIRSTSARSPMDEKLALKVPPGFKIELFASEPDIGKPMNISFDAKGRLWVTQSSEYPFFDSTGTGPDRISILEDTDHDGKADVFTVFADSLNIPIGIVPVENGAIAYSIPYVYHLMDSDGDDHVDQRKVLLKGFEYKDTHGMINNFFRGLDGWIHADHGFSNVSEVVGTDNRDPVVMNSGNTFRFMPDGTGVEFTTTGRVNPFGYAMDEFGYMYSVDCHSSPLYQLIRGADYPHFGKQPTGIGFGPSLMSHEYASTALAGLEYYTGNQYPEAYRQSFYMGDVLKSRVFRSTIKMEGTTPVHTWESDFVVSEDPWFRPVDVKLGPDGALYIADFYNRIIGHYEVPLDHPGRDRERGRIWRITYEGNQHQHRSNNWSILGLPALIEGLNEPSLTVRMMVADQIVDRFGSKALSKLNFMLNEQDVSTNQLIHGMWILFRLGTLDNDLISKGLHHSNEKVKVHTLKIMFELKSISEEQLISVRKLLNISGPHVQRAILLLLAEYPTNEHLPILLALKSNIKKKDTHLSYVLRQCLRDHLRNEEVMSYVHNTSWTEADSRFLADVMVGVDNMEAANFLLTHIQKFQETSAKILPYTAHIARYLSYHAMDQLVTALKVITEGDLDLQYQAFKAMKNGITQRGENVSEEGILWAVELAGHFLKDDLPENDWSVVPIGNFYRSNSWRYEQFEATELMQASNVLISGPLIGGGESTSKLQSPIFILPAELSFSLFGRKYFVGEAENTRNHSNRVELFLMGKKNPVISIGIIDEDQRQEVVWDLRPYKGQQGYLVVTDGSSAWGEYIGIGALSAGKLSLPVQNPSQKAERQIFACEVAKTYGLDSMATYINDLFTSGTTDVIARQYAAAALLSTSDKYLTVVASVLHDPEEEEFLKNNLLTILVGLRTAEAFQLVRNNLNGSPLYVQKNIVQALASEPAGIDEIMTMVANLTISPKILLEPKINELLAVSMSNEQTLDYHRLIENVQPFSQEIEQLIQERVNNYLESSSSPLLGFQIYQQNCSVCHQIGNEGGNIGPQLDAIGTRGIQSITEKILDPNRNISKSFINYSIKLKAGTVKQGLFRRDEGKVRVFANAAGQEFSIPIDDIVSQRALPFTLMPDNFSQIISEEDYYHLMSYLIDQN